MALLKITVNTNWNSLTEDDIMRLRHLSREDFLRIPELAINPLGDRIVHAFFYESRNNQEDRVDFKVYSKCLFKSLLVSQCLCVSMPLSSSHHLKSTVLIWRRLSSISQLLPKVFR